MVGCCVYVISKNKLTSSRENVQIYLTIGQIEPSVPSSKTLALGMIDDQCDQIWRIFAKLSHILKVLGNCLRVYSIFGLTTSLEIFPYFLLGTFSL